MHKNGMLRFFPQFFAILNIFGDAGALVLLQTCFFFADFRDFRNFRTTGFRADFSGGGFFRGGRGFPDFGAAGNLGKSGRSDFLAHFSADPRISGFGQIFPGGQKSSGARISGFPPDSARDFGGPIFSGIGSRAEIRISADFRENGAPEKSPDLAFFAGSDFFDRIAEFPKNPKTRICAKSDKNLVFSRGARIAKFRKNRTRAILRDLQFFN
jgi:hypothetical protein